MGFSRQEYWSGLLFLLPGIIPTQGLNPSLLCLLQPGGLQFMGIHMHWQVDSVPLNCLGSLETEQHNADMISVVLEDSLWCLAEKKAVRDGRRGSWKGSRKLVWSPLQHLRGKGGLGQVERIYLADRVNCSSWWSGGRVYEKVSCQSESVGALFISVGALRRSSFRGTSMPFSWGCWLRRLYDIHIEMFKGRGTPNPHLRVMLELEGQRKYVAFGGEPWMRVNFSWHSIGGAQVRSQVGARCSNR